MPPRYVLEEMDVWEIDEALQGVYLRSKELWETSRMIVYSMVKMNTTDPIRITDLIHFPWDDQPEEADEIGYEDRLKEIMEMEKLLNQKTTNNGS